MDLKEDNLTPWFEGGIKPVRHGVYVQECGGTTKRLGFQHWDGFTWGPWCLSVESAADRRPDQRADLRYQNDRWRGLNKRPNVNSTADHAA